MIAAARPGAGEYAPAFEDYVARIADDEDIVAVLSGQLDEAGDCTLADLIAEWGHVRQATVALLRSLPAAAWHRRGTANNNPVSVRALAYVIAGHVRHHLETLQTRYE